VVITKIKVRQKAPWQCCDQDSIPIPIPIAIPIPMGANFRQPSAGNISSKSVSVSKSNNPSPYAGRVRKHVFLLNRPCSARGGGSAACSLASLPPVNLIAYSLQSNSPPAADVP